MSVVIAHDPACAAARSRVSQRRSIALLALVTSLGCERGEPPRTQPAASAPKAAPSPEPARSTAPAAAAAPSATAPAAAPSAAAAASPAVAASSSATSGAATATGRRCIAPWPKRSAPRVLPASVCPSAPAAAPALPEGRVRFLDAPGTPEVVVERALDDDARALGLMYRTHMDAGRGMLFSWDEEETRSFWMRNTCIPLDMLFIASDGTIVGILEQVPTLNTLPRSVPCPAQHVLELNAGWAREHGVAPGQRVNIDT